MEKLDWTYILAIVVLVLATILAVFDKISAEDLMKIFLLVVGALLGVGAGYFAGKYTAHMEAVKK